MKNSKTILLILCVLQFSIMSCKKQLVEKYEESQANKVKKFTDIKAAKNFKWATMNVVSINFPSNQNDARISTLKITDAEGNVYFQKLQKANEAFTGSIEVPAHLETLKMSYGGIHKDVNLTSGKIEIELK